MVNQPTQSPVPRSTRKPSHRVRGCLITVGIVVLLVVSIAIVGSSVRPIGQVVQAVTGQQMRFNGPAMEPTIHDGQMLYVRTYLGSTPARGDIVVYHDPTNPDIFPVGRVIAVPGDTICISPTTVTLNGSPLHEAYLLGGREDNSRVNPGWIGCHTLESNQYSHPYFVMGDNRGDSVDSRVFGPVSQESIIGKVVGIFG